ncbi:hypothetical protein [Mycobacterium malmoense]|uniref:hypothetical protein n=1 Tax=Mycobacterium malmoense TaxID=1780 RepID=UPI0015A5F463|nr:hypothetical protein [Mycobacterium malmoense]
MPGPGSDAVEQYPGQRSGGACPARSELGDDPGAVKAGGFGSGTEHPGHDVTRQRYEAD